MQNLFGGSMVDARDESQLGKSSECLRGSKPNATCCAGDHGDTSFGQSGMHWITPVARRDIKAYPAGASSCSRTMRAYGSRGH
jgi:hypothetical protein